MSRTLTPYSVRDISALARSLRTQLTELGHIPGQVEMLNLLARAAGHRNYQSLRAQSPELDPIDAALLQRLARHFDRQRRLARWPSKANLLEPCLWVLWSQLPPKQGLSEDELNQRLRALHLFGDHALLRRELVDRTMLARTPDGRSYRRVERPPSPEGRALIHHLSTIATEGQGE